MTDKFEENYQEFWKDIVEPEGKLDLEQVKKELSDYHFLLQEVPKVYHKITGCLSKPNYHSNIILSLHEEKYLDKDCTQCDVRDMIEDCSNKKELVKLLRDYFDIND